MQLLSGLPQVEHGLESPFTFAGKDNNRAIRQLWNKSLARVLLAAITQVKAAGATDSVIDLNWFVVELSQIEAVRHLVRWEDDDRYAGPCW